MLGIRLPKTAASSSRSATPAQRERQLNACLRKALFAVLAHDFETAEEALVEAVRNDSNAHEAYLALARFFRNRGELGRAIRVHQNLLLRADLDASRRVVVLAELAQDLEQGGFLQRAVASYEEMLAHDSRNRVALRALTKLHASLQEYPQALAASKRLARVERRKDPAREALLLSEMAEFKHRAGEPAAARKAAKKALRRDSDCTAAQILLGRLEAEAGRDKAALLAWKKVPAMNREAAVDVYPRVEAAYASLDIARGFEEWMRELIAEQPEDPGARLALARHLSARGDLALAIAELRALLEHEPSHLEGRIALGRLLLADKREAEALFEFGSLMDLLETRGLPASAATRDALAEGLLE